MSIAQKLMSVNAVGSDDYWVTILGDTFNDGGKVGIATIDKRVVTHTKDTMTGQQPFVSGAILTEFDETGLAGTLDGYFRNDTNAQARGISVDNSGNLYTSVQYTSSTSGNYRSVDKFSAVGTPTIQRYLGPTASSPQFNLAGVVHNGSGSVLYAGSTNRITGNTTPYLISLADSNLSTVNFEVAMTTSGVNYDFASVKLDGVGNVYCFGQNSNHPTVGIRDVYVVKFNAAGSVQWQIDLGRSSSDVRFFGAGVDQEGNSYVLADYYNTKYQLLFKVNSSGVLQWTKLLSMPSGLSSTSMKGDITVRGDGSFFVGMFLIESGTIDGFVYVTSFDPSGNLAWSNVWFDLDASPSFDIHGMAVNSFGTLVVSMNMYDALTGHRQWIAKLPPDGSGLGTYSSYTYAAKALVVESTTGATNTKTLSYGATTENKGGYTPSRRSEIPVQTTFAIEL